jgi:hypothetical protein
MKTKKASQLHHNRRNKKALVMAMILFCIAFNSFLTYTANTPVESLSVPYDGTSPERGLQPPRPKRRPKYSDLVLTMAPQNSSEHTVGMVHVGKTAGSTISQLLRNGCTSFVRGTCRNITNESEVSKRVVRRTEARCLCVWCD